MTSLTKSFSSLFLFTIVGCATATIDDPGTSLEDDGTGSTNGAGATDGAGATVGAGSTDGAGSTVGAGSTDGAGATTGSGGDLVGDGDGDTGSGGGLIGGDGDGDVASGGTGSGGTPAAGGSGAGGTPNPGDCTVVSCSGGSDNQPIGTGDVCFTVSGPAMGWQVSSNTGCTITVDGAPATAGAGSPVGEMVVSGCMYDYSAWSCW